MKHQDQFKKAMAEQMAKVLAGSKAFGEPTPEEAELEAKIQEVLDKNDFKHFADQAYREHLFAAELRYPLTPQNKEEK